MKTVFLHGLGQTAQDWKKVVQQLSISDVDCPELFSSTEDEISYSQILGDLEQRYSEVKEPLRICAVAVPGKGYNALAGRTAEDEGNDV